MPPSIKIIQHVDNGILPLKDEASLKTSLKITHVQSLSEVSGMK